MLERPKVHSSNILLFYRSFVESDLYQFVDSIFQQDPERRVERNRIEGNQTVFLDLNVINLDKLDQDFNELLKVEWVLVVVS